MPRSSTRCGAIASIPASLLLMNAGTYGTVLRWMPPLVVDEREVSLALDAFGDALKNV